MLHITFELLKAAESGEIPPRTLLEAGIRHLTELCPHCAREYRRWYEHRSSQNADYDRVFRVMPALLARAHEDRSKAELAADRDLKSLLRLPPDRRIDTVLRATTRYRGPLLAAALLSLSQRALPDHRDAYHFADLARSVLLRSPAREDNPNLQVLALAYLANARRLADDLQSADDLFCASRALCRTFQVTDPATLAERASAEGVFRIVKRQYPEAQALLLQAIALYATAGDTAGSIRPLITLGTLCYYQGQNAKALEYTQSALRLLGDLDQPKLVVGARFNSMLYMAEAGEHQAANDALRLYSASIREHIPANRILWLQGKIAAGFRQFAQAEDTFRTLQRAFLEEEAAYDAAMVSLDLALLLLRQGRLDELSVLAREIHQVFAAQKIRPEANAALILFVKAVETGKISIRLLKELSVQLRSLHGSIAQGA